MIPCVWVLPERSAHTLSRSRQAHPGKADGVKATSLPDTFVQAPVTPPEKLAVLEASGKTPADVRLLER